MARHDVFLAYPAEVGNWELEKVALSAGVCEMRISRHREKDDAGTKSREMQAEAWEKSARVVVLLFSRVDLE
jgi:hypothetical protein